MAESELQQIHYGPDKCYRRETWSSG
jgi:hypothetical protein